MKTRESEAVLPDDQPASDKATSIVGKRWYRNDTHYQNYEQDRAHRHYPLVSLTFELSDDSSGSSAPANG
jgi:hypothetical protein